MTSPLLHLRRWFRPEKNYGDEVCEYIKSIPHMHRTTCTNTGESEIFREPKFSPNKLR